MADIRSYNSLAYAVRTNSSVPPPSSIVDGDIILIISMTGAADPATQSFPAGFTAVTEGDWPITWSNEGWDLSIAAAWKVASSESGNYTVTHNSAGAEAAVYSISGADTTTPINPNPTVGSGTDTNGVAPSIVTPRNASAVIGAWGSWDAAGPTSPPGGSTPTFTETYDGGATGVFYAAHGVLATAGDTGDKTVVNNNGSGKPWRAGLICVQAAAGGAPADVFLAYTINGAQIV